jgi:hypothetical protein
MTMPSPSFVAGLPVDELRVTNPFGTDVGDQVEVAAVIRAAGPAAESGE